MAKSETNLPGAKPGAYLWEAPDQALTVHLSLDVVDRLLQDVMRGFGAVPKRGAEVGGVLLGRSKGGAHAVLEIDDYELAPIQYQRGPSYLLSEADLLSFHQMMARLRDGADDGLSPVGFFRSNTRDAIGLGAEDLDLMQRFFPASDEVILFIRPYATRVSMAGFYFRENGLFQEGPPVGEFPFRRKHLGGDEAPAGPPAPGRTQRAFDEAARPASAEVLEAPAVTPERMEVAVRPPERQVGPAEEFYDIEAQSKKKSGWMWLPLSFIFLLLGVLLGFQGALTLRPQPAVSTGDPFRVALAVARDGENLNVRWDRQSQAIRAARSGSLTIEDGAYKKTVELDASQLQTGSVVYRHNSGDVKFTLELTMREGNKMAEKVHWKQ